MKELPILFKAPMVRAILDGRKTQTRRVVKPQPEYRENECLPGHYGTWFHGWNLDHKHVIPSDYWKHCPYGQPGDRLWVRETHAIVPRTAYAMSAGVQQVLRPDDDHDAAVFREGWELSRPGRWRPSIHMPRWASRITLEITDVRVERLQDVSAKDAKAEGCQPPDLPTEIAGVAGDYVADERTSFAILWNRINGAGSWDANPWVWVVEFRQVEQ